MTFVLLAGILATFLLTTVIFAAQRAPTRVSCPECGHRTEAIHGPEWLRRGLPMVRLRWCAACGWEGVGREGPHWVPGQRIAHDSGFHWGDARTPADFGFRFASPEDELISETPPDHPSGFRFGDSRIPQAAHFTWSRRMGRGPFTDDAAPGFVWGDDGGAHDVRQGPDAGARPPTRARNRLRNRPFGSRDVG